MDELAELLGMDPIVLREVNEPDSDPETGCTFSSRHLLRCLREGAERFGWSERNPRPRAREEDGWLVGLGVSSSTYPVNRMPNSEARVRYAGEGRYSVEIGAADIGTGTWTTLGQIAADALGVDADAVEMQIGSTYQPHASVAGGSSGMTSWGSTVVEASRVFRERFGSEPAQGDEVTAAMPENPADEEYSMSAFGAQFAEVRVRADTGEIRVPRMVGVFDAGRIINPRTARSQFIGGMTMGISMALHETSVVDTRFGHVVNHDLAEYHVAANADIGVIDVSWLDEPDPHTNPMGSKGIGEIGMVGTAAAVANAAYNATGVRVRELPLTLDHFLG
jgi:xanthine dehydrogenase YagR molybdenum-binding subunit